MTNKAWRTANKDKIAAYRKKWFTANRDKQQAYNRKAAGQTNLPTRPEPKVCEVCGGNSNTPHLCEDHNHATGAFRGWLCNRCNMALGLLKDNPHTVLRMFDYLLIGDLM